MEHVTNQKQVERQILELVKTYNVLYKRQIYAFFAVDGKEKFVGKALHTLLKEHLIYINEVTKTVSQHEDAYQLREKGTLKAFWVLLSLMEHVVIVENPEEIPQIEIPNVIGFCTVQEEEGGVEYYRRE